MGVQPGGKHGVQPGGTPARTFVCWLLAVCLALRWLGGRRGGWHGSWLRRRSALGRRRSWDRQGRVGKGGCGWDRPVPVRGGASRAAQLVQRLRVLPALKRRASQLAQLVWA